MSSWECGPNTRAVLGGDGDDEASERARYHIGSTNSIVWNSNIGSQNLFTRVYIEIVTPPSPLDLLTTMYEQAGCQGRSAYFFEMPDFANLNWATNLIWNGFTEDKEFRSIIIEPNSAIKFIYEASDEVAEFINENDLEPLCVDFDPIGLFDYEYHLFE